MNYEKTNATGFLKDTKTGTIINTNEAEYQQVLAARQKQHAEREIRKDVEKLKNDIGDIKAMLVELMRKTT